MGQLNETGAEKKRKRQRKIAGGRQSRKVRLR
jgi:hypothetical protein